MVLGDTFMIPPQFGFLCVEGGLFRVDGVAVSCVGKDFGNSFVVHDRFLATDTKHGPWTKSPPSPGSALTFSPFSPLQTVTGRPCLFVRLPVRPLLLVRFSFRHIYCLCLCVLVSKC